MEIEEYYREDEYIREMRKKCQHWPDAGISTEDEPGDYNYCYCAADRCSECGYLIRKRYYN